MTTWNKIEISKEILEDYYVEQKLSISQIAKQLNCSTTPVHRLLREFNIPIRNLSEACKKVYVSEMQLRKWYFEDKLSTKEIGRKLDCTHSTVINKFKEFGIKSRGNLGTRKPIIISKKELDSLYYQQNLSLKSIAKKLKCSEGGVQRIFIKYELKSRGNNNRACKYQKSDFSGDLIEKAHMLGFRFGDLNVMKRVNVISVRCSTTKLDQIDLIKSLFSKYTTPHVWKAKRGTYEIVCLVNGSFNFLLRKEDKIPKWIMKKNALFLSFLAGYTDAEGSFYFKTYSGKHINKIGMFEIQSQDKIIIHQFAKRLNAIGVDVREPSISKPEGYVDKRKVRNNKDMWRISVDKKQSLWRLIFCLSKKCKHQSKLHKMRQIKKNLLLRNSAPYCQHVDLFIPNKMKLV